MGHGPPQPHHLQLLRLRPARRRGPAAPARVRLSRCFACCMFLSLSRATTTINNRSGFLSVWDTSLDYRRQHTAIADAKIALIKGLANVATSWSIDFAPKTLNTKSTVYKITFPDGFF